MTGQLWTVTEGKGMFLLLFLETYSPEPLAALEQLHGEAGSWKESSLTAAGTNTARRETGVVLGSACLWLQTPSTSLSIFGPTPKKCVNTVKGVTAY